MKLTKEQADYIRSKPSFTNEGLAKSLYRKFLKTKLSKDKDFMDAVDKYDKAAGKLAKRIKDLEDQGIEIPDDLKRLAKMK